LRRSRQEPEPPDTDETDTDEAVKKAKLEEGEETEKETDLEVQEGEIKCVIGSAYLCTQARACMRAPSTRLHVCLCVSWEVW
jgi:hypothetical protein